MGIRKESKPDTKGNDKTTNVIFSGVKKLFCLFLLPVLFSLLVNCAAKTPVHEAMKTSELDGCVEIFHVSDLHFKMKPADLGGDDGPSANPNESAEKLLNHVYASFSESKYKNKFILITGDITENGCKEEYKLAEEALLKFKDHVIITPGNHDYGTFLGTFYQKSKAEHFDNEFAKDLGFQHTFIDKEVYTLEAKGFMIIGLNSCRKRGLCDLSVGEIGSKQMERLKSILDNNKTRKKLLFLHHIPHRDADWYFAMNLLDWEELINAVKGKVDYISFGHQGKMKPEYTRDKRDKSKKRPMRALIIDVESKKEIDVGKMTREDLGKLRKAGRIITLLDANSSKEEKAFFRILWDGEKITHEKVGINTLPRMEEERCISPRNENRK